MLKYGLSMAQTAFDKFTLMYLYNCKRIFYLQTTAKSIDTSSTSDWNFSIDAYQACLHSGTTIQINDYKH